MGRPNRKWQLLGVIGALVLVVAVCLLAPGADEGKEKSTATSQTAGKQAENTQSTSHNPTPSIPLPVPLKDGVGRLGDPKAKVKIDVFFPGHSGCGAETADFAHRVYLANKTRVQVVFVDFESPGGSQYQGAAGMHCSGVAINGRQDFDIKTSSGDLKTVGFGSNFGDRWNQDQFLAALDIAFKQAYGQPCNHKIPAAKPTAAEHTKFGAPHLPTPEAKQ